MTDREATLKSLGLLVASSSAQQFLAPTYLGTVAVPDMTFSGYGAYTPIKVGSQTSRKSDANVERDRTRNR
jgi:hypothetical protein